MKPKTKENLKFIAIGLVLVGIMAIERKCVDGTWLGDSIWTSAQATNVSIEGNSFICQDDGALSEQHVGVADAVSNDSGIWVIVYTDGATGQYKQLEGETCAIQYQDKPGI